MARKLTKTLSKSETTTESVRLNKQEEKFKIAIEVKLENGYEFKNMTPEHLKKFQDFLDATIQKGLTISEVEKIYLRKQGLSDAPPTICNGKELIHFGKDRNPFRLFGYYNAKAYFVVCRIDGEHKTNS